MSSSSANSNEKPARKGIFGRTTKKTATRTADEPSQGGESATQERLAQFPKGKKRGGSDADSHFREEAKPAKSSKEDEAGKSSNKNSRKPFTREEMATQICKHGWKCRGNDKHKRCPRIHVMTEKDRFEEAAKEARAEAEAQILNERLKAYKEKVRQTTLDEYRMKTNDSPVQTQNAEATPPVSRKPCKFGAICSRGGCKFTHPKSRKSKLCRFGPTCKFAQDGKCPFVHTPAP